MFLPGDLKNSCTSGDSENPHRCRLAETKRHRGQSAAAVNTNPTLETYNDKLYQKIRGMGTTVSNIPELKVKWSPIWGNGGMAGQDWVKDATTPDKLKAKVKIVLDQLQKLEADFKG